MLTLVAQLLLTFPLCKVWLRTYSVTQIDYVNFGCVITWWCDNMKICVDGASFTTPPTLKLFGSFNFFLK